MASKSKEFTIQEVARHNTRQDLYLILHNKVYDATSFLDKHPGGEEVLLDIAGKDSTDAFEDIGHSDEAREILADLEIGVVKKTDAQEHTAAALTATQSKVQQSSNGFLFGFSALVLLGGALSCGAYQFLHSAGQGSSTH